MNNAKKENATAKENLVGFISRNRTGIIILLSVLIIVLIALGAFEMYRNNRIEKSIILTEELQQSYYDWMQSSDDNDKTNALYDDLMSRLDKVREDAYGDYSQMKLTFIEARIKYDEEKWNEAANLFYSVYEEYPANYLASLSLMNAAYSFESAGNIEKAKENFQLVIDEFTGKSADVSEAIFNMGRLSENAGNDEKALEYYNTILTDFSESSWKNISQNRIIYINTK